MILEDTPVKSLKRVFLEQTAHFARTVVSKLTPFEKPSQKGRPLKNWVVFESTLNNLKEEHKLLTTTQEVI